MSKCNKCSLCGKPRGANDASRNCELCGVSFENPGGEEVKEAERKACANAVDRLEAKVVSEKVAAILTFRHLLGREDPPIDLVISTGVVPRLIDFMSDPDEPRDVSMEAAWAVTNIASGTTEHVAYLVENDVVDHCKKAIEKCKCPQTFVQLTWLVGNIVGDSSQYRDLVNEVSMVTAIHDRGDMMDKNMAKEISNIAWAVSNMVRGKFEGKDAKSKISQDVVPLLTKLLYWGLEEADETTIMDSLWGLSYAADGLDVDIDTAVKFGCIPLVMRALRSALDANHTKSKLLAPALRVIGNVLSGDDPKYTDLILTSGGLELLSKILLLNVPKHGKPALWAVSNVSAGSELQRRYLLEHFDLAMMLDHMRSMEDPGVFKEAMYVLGNWFTPGKLEQKSSKSGDSHDKSSGEDLFSTKTGEEGEKKTEVNEGDSGEKDKEEGGGSGEKEQQEGGSGEKEQQEGGSGVVGASSLLDGGEDVFGNTVATSDSKSGGSVLRFKIPKIAYKSLSLQEFDDDDMYYNALLVESGAAVFLCDALNAAVNDDRKSCSQAMARVPESFVWNWIRDAGHNLFELTEIMSEDMLEVLKEVVDLPSFAEAYDRRFNTAHAAKYCDED